MENIMLKNMIDSVCEAEKEAEKRIAGAKDEAAYNIKTAKLKAEQIKTDILKKSKQHCDDVIGEAEKTAKKKSEEALAAYNEKAKELCEAAEKKQSQIESLCFDLLFK